MAALTNIGDGGNELSEVLPSEAIKGWLDANYNRFPSFIVGWNDVTPDGQGRTPALQLAPALSLSGSSATTEGENAINPTSFDPTETTLTVSDFSVKLAFTEQAEADAALALEPMYVNSIMMGLAELRENEFGGAILASTNQSDNSGQALTHDMVMSAIGTLKGVDVNPGTNGLAGYIHSVQMRDLMVDAASSTAASFANINPATAGAASVSPGVGLPTTVYMVGGVPLYETNAVQAFDANNYSGAIMAAGEGGGIWISHRPVRDFTGSPEVFALRKNGIDSDSGLLLQRILIGWTRFGVGITRSNQIVELISSQ